MKRIAWHWPFYCVLGIMACCLVFVAREGIARSEEKRTVPANLHFLGIALMAYGQDYDDVLPSAKTQKQLQEVLEPYVEDNSAFLDAEGKPFRFNLGLAGRSLDSVYREGYKKGEGVVAFYETRPRIDGSRWLCRMPKPREYFGNEPAWAYTGENVMFGMPTVSPVTAQQWKKTRKLFKLP